MSLLEELKRRNVVKVATVYVITAWLVLQVADVILGNIDAPSWIFSTLLLVLGIGLVFAIMFAWLYEMTPDGIRRESDVDRSEPKTETTGQRLNVALAVLATAAVVLIAWNVYDAAPSGEAQPGNIATDRDANGDRVSPSETIAVLPLLNMSAVLDNEFFAGGVHEEILTNLSRIEGLQVISRTTALRYVNSDKSLREIGRELGARYIVEGSVRRIENHVRVTVQLIDATTDIHLWANNYDRELKDVFATQSEVAREISNSLHLEIQPDSIGILSDMPTTSVRAYDNYIKARSIERSQVLSAAALRQQTELLEAAVLEDPDFTEAWAYLKRVLDEVVIGIVLRDWFSDSADDAPLELNEVLASRTRAMNKALALDPDNIETLLALASEDFLAERSRETEAERKRVIDRILEIDPDNAEAWRHLGWYLRFWAIPQEASEAFLMALKVDPLHARNVEAAHFHFRSMGNEEMTAQLADRLTEIAPEIGQEEGIGRIPSAVKLENLIGLFVETADESIIARYEATYEAESADFTPRSPRDSIDWYRALAMILKNDLDRLADAMPEPHAAHPSRAEVANFVWFKASKMAAQNFLGREEEARVTAEEVLRGFEMLRLDIDASEINQFRILVAMAYSTLGDKVRIAELRQRIVDDLGERLDTHIPLDYIGFAYIDTEQAVDAVLAQAAEHPNWVGTDLMAANFVMSLPLLVHPDMQAFYVEEGKWIEYLAARVPEYEKYRQQ